MLRSHGAENVVVGQHVVDAEALGLKGEGDDVGRACAEFVLGEDRTDLHQPILPPTPVVGSAVLCVFT